MARILWTCGVRTELVVSSMQEPTYTLDVLWYTLLGNGTVAFRLLCRNMRLLMCLLHIFLGHRRKLKTDCDG